MGVEFTSKIYGTYDAAMKYYFVVVEHAEQLDKLFTRYFYLAAQNEFMLVMDAHSAVEVENEVYKKKKAYPVVTCTLFDENSYGITIGHDGQGMDLFTLKKEWTHRDGLMQTLGNIHGEQWNEEYYGESEK